MLNDFESLDHKISVFYDPNSQNCSTVSKIEVNLHGCTVDRPAKKENPC